MLAMATWRSRPPVRRCTGGAGIVAADRIARPEIADLEIASGSMKNPLPEMVLVSTKGTVVLPAKLRVQDEIKPGQEFTIERIDRGEYRLVRIERRNAGLVDWL